MSPPRASIAIKVSPYLAILIAAASLIGILDATTYVHETASWAAQGLGQDWFDLLILAPSLLFASGWTARDAERGGLILGGVLACTLYTFAIYTFSVHFNQLFLVYCAIFGLSFYALFELLGRRLAELDVDAQPARERAAGGFLIAMGVLFAGLWLSEIVPALARRATPVTLVETGLLTNPVHVLDLSIVLPAFVVAGVALVRARPLGQVLAPVVASFSVLMALSIAALMLVMRLVGVTADLGVAAAMFTVAMVSVAVLAHLVRASPAPRVPGDVVRPC